MLRTLSIRHRLLSLSALGVVLTVAVGLTAMFALWRAADHADQMDRQAEVHDRATRVLAEALTLRRFEKELLLSARNASTAAEFRRRFLESDNELRKLLSELEERVFSEDDRLNVATMRTHLDAYDLAMAAVYERVRKGQVNIEQDRFAITAAAEREMRGLETANQLLVERARSRQVAERNQLNLLSNQLGVLLAIATGLFALVAMIAGYSVNRSIARPLIRTLNVLEKVAGGDLDQQPELGHTDEMGRIAMSLNTAIQRMKHDREEIERLAATDPLTGLMNRRAFTEAATNELTRARRYGYPFTLLLFDIDHFKKINDRHGHGVGDIVLARVGKLIKEQIRTSDFAGRWGGEEFVVALPHVGLDGAAVAAARMRIATQEMGVVTDKGRPVLTTVSIGVAELRQDDTLHSLTERADHGMYMAKNQGRNRVIINDGTLVSMPPPGQSRAPTSSSRAG